MSFEPLIALLRRVFSAEPAAEPACPSCHGTGWASIVARGHCHASGLCRCVGGSVWAVPPERSEQS